MGPPYVIRVWAMWNEQLSGVPIPGCKNWLLLYGMPPLWLDIVWLTSTHGLCSGTSLLERGWTLLQSGIAPSSVSVCWGFPWTIRILFYFFHVPLDLGTGPVCCLSLCNEMSTTQPHLLAIVLPGDIYNHLDNNSETWGLWNTGPVLYHLKDISGSLGVCPSTCTRVAGTHLCYV